MRCVCPAEEKTQPVHGAVCVFGTGQACEPSKGASHPDGMAAEPSHASGDGWGEQAGRVIIPNSNLQ